MPISSNEELYQTSEILELLDIPIHRLAYLFESRRLDKNNFIQVNGRRMYRESDVVKIIEALAKKAKKKNLASTLKDNL